MGLQVPLLVEKSLVTVEGEFFFRDVAPGERITFKTHSVQEEEGDGELAPKLKRAK